MTQRTADGTAYDLQGSGPPVALIHGLGLRRAMWRWQLPALLPGFRVLTYDLLGHGESPAPTTTPDLTLLSEQLLGVMDHCGIGRAHVVGFSLGGMIARRVAIDHPDRVSALVVLSSAHARTEAEREAVRERVRQVASSGPSSTADDALERWFTPAYRDASPRVMDLVREWILANDPAVYPDLYRVLAEGDAEIADGLERITCPTLVMTGEEDRGNSPEMAAAMAARIAGARTAILPGLRHMALAESPDEVNGILTTFLLAALES